MKSITDGKFCLQYLNLTSQSIHQATLKGLCHGCLVNFVYNTSHASILFGMERPGKMKYNQNIYVAVIFLFQLIFIFPLF